MLNNNQNDVACVSTTKTSIVINIEKIAKELEEQDSVINRICDNFLNTSPESGKKSDTANLGKIPRALEEIHQIILEHNYKLNEVLNTIN